MSSTPSNPLFFASPAFFNPQVHSLGPLFPSGEEPHNVYAIALQNPDGSSRLSTNYDTMTQGEMDAISELCQKALQLGAEVVICNTISPTDNTFHTDVTPVQTPDRSWASHSDATPVADTSRISHRADAAQTSQNTSDEFLGFETGEEEAFPSEQMKERFMIDETAFTMLSDTHNPRGQLRIQLKALTKKVQEFGTNSIFCPE